MTLNQMLFYLFIASQCHHESYMWIQLLFLVVKVRKEKTLLWTFIDILKLAVCHSIISPAPMKIFCFSVRIFTPVSFMHCIYGLRKITWQHTDCSAHFTFNKIDAATDIASWRQICTQCSVVCLYVYCICACILQIHHYTFTMWQRNGFAL